MSRGGTPGWAGLLWTSCAAAIGCGAAGPIPLPADGNPTTASARGDHSTPAERPAAAATTATAGSQSPPSPPPRSTPTTAGSAPLSPPPDPAAAAAILEGLMSAPGAHQRVQVLIVDDDDCLTSLRQDPAAVARMPAGVRLESGPEGDAVTSNLAGAEGFDQLHQFLAGYPLPPERELVYSRLYEGEEQLGWLALCTKRPPLLGPYDLVRRPDASSLTFELTEDASDRVHAYRPATTRLAFTVDGQVLLTVAAIEALQRQLEPTFTLFRR